MTTWEWRWVWCPSHQRDVTDKWCSLKKAKIIYVESNVVILQRNVSYKHFGRCGCMKMSPQEANTRIVLKRLETETHKNSSLHLYQLSNLFVDIPTGSASKTTFKFSKIIFWEVPKIFDLLIIRLLVAGVE